MRNQYGSLPLHMAASNQASAEVVRLLIDSYPDALHLQNDDGMTPLDLALADESASETVVAMLEGRPPPPEMSQRQKAEKLGERAIALERKLTSLREASTRQAQDLSDAVAAVRRLADRFPHALYAAGVDPNELEIALSSSITDEAGLSGRVGGKKGQTEAEAIILDAVKRRTASVVRDSKGERMAETSVGVSSGPRDRVEDLLSSIVGLDHIKSQVRGLRRTTEICDLRESLLPHALQGRRGLNGIGSNQALVLSALSDDFGRPRASHMVFVGNPGSGKSAVARLLAKAYHELGILRKPKFLEVERMDLVARDKHATIAKTQEVLEEARGGILFIDEANMLGAGSKRSKLDYGVDAINEIIASIDASAHGTGDNNLPLIILAGFPVEMHRFLHSQHDLRKRFPLTFEFPDYSCIELAKIFVDLAHAKGFDLEESLTVDVIGKLLEDETTAIWRSERNGRVSEMLLAGAKQEVRRRMREASFMDEESGGEVDPQLIIHADLLNISQAEFK